MEATHSSQQGVTEVTPVPHKEAAPFFPAWAPASTGVYSDQPWVGPAAGRLNHSHLAPPGSHRAWLFLKLLLLSILPAVKLGEILKPRQGREGRF